MKRLMTMLLAVVLLCGNAVAQGKRYQTFGVAFYNLENLFDTLNNNGKYDLEFSPEGKNRWDGKKYKSKLKNMSYAISQMTTKLTPMGPALLGVSEIENKSVLEDLVRQDAIKDRMYQVIHHDSPDRRGVDVALLYNPRFFKPINVTNHTLKIEGLNYFKTRDQMCVVGLLGGERVGVIVNHWPSRRGGTEQSSYLREAAARENGATVFGYYVDDPERFGIVEFDENGKAISLEEKPKNPKSNYCVTGLYFYDNKVVEYAKNLKPSARGELEITDLNRIYLEDSKLNVELLGQGFTWLDTGTHESLVDATNFVKTVETHQHRKIACLEEIAYLNGWITKEDVLKVYEVLKKNQYGQFMEFEHLTMAPITFPCLRAG